MLSNPNTFTGISGLSLSNLSIAFKLIGNSIPLKLRDSAYFLKHFVIDLFFFSISLFAGFKALAVHHLKHWLSAFFILTIAFLLARNFRRGTQELPFNGSYPIVWISSATIEWNIHPLPFIRNFARSSRTCSVRDSKIRSCLLIQEQFHFLIWIDVLPRGFK